MIKGSILSCISIMFAFAVSLSTELVEAQTETADRPCSAPEASQFDFWIGKWDLVWNDTMTGTNVITKELDGCVIHESFSNPIENFDGRSYSVYDPSKKLWRQTWVDNQGNYLDFEGGFENEIMTLGRTFVGPKGKTVMQRMTFYDISDDSLHWSWESSLDGGKNWKQLWLIHYKRTKE